MSSMPLTYLSMHLPLHRHQLSPCTSTTAISMHISLSLSDLEFLVAGPWQPFRAPALERSGVGKGLAWRGPTRKLDRAAPAAKGRGSGAGNRARVGVGPRRGQGEGRVVQRLASVAMGGRSALPCPLDGLWNTMLRAKPSFLRRPACDVVMQGLPSRHPLLSVNRQVIKHRQWAATDSSWRSPRGFRSTTERGSAGNTCRGANRRYQSMNNSPSCFWYAVPSPSIPRHSVS